MCVVICLFSACLGDLFIFSALVSIIMFVFLNVPDLVSTHKDSCIVHLYMCVSLFSSSNQNRIPPLTTNHSLLRDQDISVVSTASLGMLQGGLPAVGLRGEQCAAAHPHLSA